MEILYTIYVQFFDEKTSPSKLLDSSISLHCATSGKSSDGNTMWLSPLILGNTKYRNCCNFAKKGKEEENRTTINRFEARSLYLQASCGRTRPRRSKKLDIRAPYNRDTALWTLSTKSGIKIAEPIYRLLDAGRVKGQERARSGIVIAILGVGRRDFQSLSMVDDVSTGGRDGGVKCTRITCVTKEAHYQASALPTLRFVRHMSKSQRDLSFITKLFNISDGNLTL
ncbi:hypothetical protein WN51_12273 [Melipona quadrifasciata]|uniref:Uncharacterized protein n=1 Tax=Melipona quadrifasciata TaxID=166423 RepID=A0A0M9A482_9HYME|nr:hypothetical protein WN51_12273 [Melipona quadrifasciata]